MELDLNQDMSTSLVKKNCGKTIFKANMARFMDKSLKVYLVVNVYCIKA